jgi:Arc/MetJ family transcription regulator
MTRKDRGGAFSTFRARRARTPAGQPARRRRYFSVAKASLQPLDLYIRIGYRVYISKERALMAVTMTSIRLDTDLADEAVKVLKAKNRTDAVHIALREIVGLKRFKALMKKNSGRLKFSGLDE